MKTKIKIQETKEKIISKLEGITSHKLADEYIKAEKKLLKGLESLKNFGSFCNCDNREIIRTIFEGEEPEISTYCLNCGGYVEE